MINECEISATECGMISKNTKEKISIAMLAYIDQQLILTNRKATHSKEVIQVMIH